MTDASGPDGGAASAYLAELAHASRTLEARAYFRLQEDRVGLGQQPLSEAGTRKLGSRSGTGSPAALALRPGLQAGHLLDRRRAARRRGAVG